MAATGMSNPQIAQALFVTLNTVETHLRHTYQKLAINRREQLADALHPPPGAPRRSLTAATKRSPCLRDAKRPGLGQNHAP
jgi:hypothetical protein